MRAAPMPMRRAQRAARAQPHARLARRRTIDFPPDSSTLFDYLSFFA